ncbi:dnaJ homolog subfamily B member 6 isoform X2 [Neltuma alba]|uniref:dnaJ homolog subfamily B member 6 isoform X2 n=1 Tax=Neltuma alba TaxID=207710 RepID=UPI0010A41E83|nr:dnaJ homolog subfamily B member 6-like isoform X2 [Prosopis alba]
MSDVVDPCGGCYYSVLGISKQATDCEIRGAYRKMALKWHPDRWTREPKLATEAKRRFQQIQEAYSVLSNKGKRTIYDAGLFGFIGDDDEGFVDFMQELILMTQTESPQEHTLEDLERLMMGMMEDHSEGTGISEFQSTTPTKKIRIK